MKWTVRRLGELTTVISSGATPLGGSAAYMGSGPVLFIRSQNVQMGTLELEDAAFVSEEIDQQLARTRVQFGDVLLNITGASIGRVAPFDRKNERANVNQHVCVIRPLPELIDFRFLTHYIATPIFQLYIESIQAGGTRQALNFSQIARFEVPVPCIEEQRKIAAILDQAEALRAKRRQALTKLDTLTQSLFLEMFGDLIENDRQWPVAKVGDFVAGFETGKSLSSPEDLPTSRFKILKISAVTKLEFDSREVKSLPSDFVPLGKEIVKAGDLLFSRANTSELIGATAYVYSTPDDLVLPDKLWRFVWKDEGSVAPLFVWHLFRQASVRREISGRGTGSSGSMKNISQAKVLDIKLGLPPIKLQLEFAEKLRVIDNGRSMMKAEIDSLDRMSKSLQHRAFRGEL